MGFLPSFRPGKAFFAEVCHHGWKELWPSAWPVVTGQRRTGGWIKIKPGEAKRPLY